MIEDRKHIQRTCERPLPTDTPDSRSASRPSAASSEQHGMEPNACQGCLISHPYVVARGRICDVETNTRKMETLKDVRDGICVDPPLCRGTSQGKKRSCAEGLLCAGETVEKIGEVDEMGERENLCWWSVSGAA